MWKKFGEAGYIVTEAQLDLEEADRYQLSRHNGRRNIWRYGHGLSSPLRDPRRAEQSIWYSIDRFTPASKPLTEFSKYWSILRRPFSTLHQPALSQRLILPERALPPGPGVRQQDRRPRHVRELRRVRCREHEDYGEEGRWWLCSERQQDVDHKCKDILFAPVAVKQVD